MATIQIEIPDDQAEALAQMCKRLGYAEMQAVSAGTTEIGSLERGLWTLRQALARGGFDTQ